MTPAEPPAPDGASAAAVREEVVQRYSPVSEVFSALAAPLRGAMVHLLTDRPATVTEIATELGIPQPLASQHLRTLRSAGLVLVGREGRAATYRLADDHVAHIFLDAFHHSGEDVAARYPSRRRT